ncbi:MAG: substrate-binding domain-containing protein [Treponema sp.]|jgi:inositol transport system substrate-binding protein|nr:substrate-binding domain-containing protein [Treponema sp.]
MKKAMLIAVVLLLAAGAAFGQQKTLVGYVSTNFNDTFQGYIMNEFKGYFAKLPQYTVEFQDAQEDVVKQQDQVNNLIAKGAKALVVVPVNTSAMGAITSAAAKAKIPLVYVNRNPFGTRNPPKNVFYVGSPEVTAGQMQAEALGKLLNGQGGVCILMGKLDNEGAIGRTKGNEDTFKAKFKGIKVLAKETGNWQRDQGMSITENWITAHGANLKAILANNDEMALGAIQALRAKGRTDVIVMGVDAIPDARAAVRNGTLAATVLQDAAGQGRGAAEAVVNALSGKAQSAVITVPFVYIDKNNIAQYR